MNVFRFVLFLCCKMVSLVIFAQFIRIFMIKHGKLYLEKFKILKCKSRLTELLHYGSIRREEWIEF